MLTLRIQIGKIETLSDKGNKATFYTPELTPEQMTELFRLQKEGECLGAFKNFGNDEVQEINIEPQKQPKSASQRLRAVIYRLWEQKAPNIEFNDYYEMYMEKLIDAIKEKLS